MTRSNHTGRFRIVAAASMIAALSAATGCSLGDQSAPSLTGPSEFGMSVTLTASPDQLPRDGSSQSVVTVVARDPQGRAVANQRMTIGLSSAAAAVSASEVITDATGRGTFSITAPSLGSVVSGNQLMVSVTPVGGNFDNSVPRTLSIALTGPSNTTLPTAAFTVSPASPEVGQVTTFNASTTTDEGTACGDACSYAWDFGDGSTDSGRIVTHRFAIGRNYTVSLTVTDAAGTTATLRQVVTVNAAAAPVVVLAVSPNPPVAGQQAVFTATATPAAGHSIQSYSWNFGDGNTQTTATPTVTKTYGAPATYTVTVTATDDLGQSGAASLQIVVSTGMTATFTASPTNPRIGDVVSFNAASSTTSNGASITDYTWDFGDATPSVSSSSPTTTHTFGAARIYVVRLTITDSTGRTATTTSTITVQ